MSLGAEVRGDSEFCSGPIAKVRRFHSDPFGPLFFPDAARMAWASAVGFARPLWFQPCAQAALPRRSEAVRSAAERRAAELRRGRGGVLAMRMGRPRVYIRLIMTQIGVLALPRNDGPDFPRSLVRTAVEPGPCGPGISMAQNGGLTTQPPQPFQSAKNCRTCGVSRQALHTRMAFVRVSCWIDIAHSLSGVLSGLLTGAAPRGLRAGSAPEVRNRARQGCDDRGPFGVCDRRGPGLAVGCVPKPRLRGAARRG